MATKKHITKTNGTTKAIRAATTTTPNAATNGKHSAETPISAQAATEDTRPIYKRVVFKSGTFPPEFLEYMAGAAHIVMFDWLRANAPYETVTLLQAIPRMHDQAACIRETGEHDADRSDIEEDVCEMLRAMCALGATFSDTMGQAKIGPYIPGTMSASR